MILLLQVGSIFELINQNPIFGVVGPDSPLYLPILGTFAVTGFPTTGASTGLQAGARTEQRRFRQAVFYSKSCAHALTVHCMQAGYSSRV